MILFFCAVNRKGLSRADPIRSFIYCFLQYIQLFFGSQKSSCPLLEELLAWQAEGHQTFHRMELPSPEGIKPTDTVLLQDSQQGWHYLF